MSPGMTIPGDFWLTVAGCGLIARDPGARRGCRGRALSGLEPGDDRTEAMLLGTGRREGERTRRVLRVITAPIFSSLRRRVAHCARAIRALLRPHRRTVLSRSVSETGKQPAERVGPPSVARGAVGKELELLFPAAVLALAAGAGEFLVKRAAITRQMGHHEARVGSSLGPCARRAMTRCSQSQLRAP